MVTYTLTATNEAGTSTAEVNVLVRQDMEELVSYFHDWRFEESGADLGTAWREPAYNDFAWNQGRGVLGVEFAGPAAPLIQTPLRLPEETGSLLTYIRGRFDLPMDPGRVSSLNLTHLVDDGAIVYLNGREVHRIGIETDVFINVRIVGNTDFEGPFALPISALVPGENVLAIALYQPYFSTSDIVWGACLQAVYMPPPGPILTLARTPQGIRLEWSADGYLLQETGNLNEPWEFIPTSENFHETSIQSGSKFFRLHRRD